MEEYKNLVKHILTNGTKRLDRTKVGTLSVFGYQSRYDLRDGFPLLTTKKVPFKKVQEELYWFLRGDTNIKTLGSAKNLWSPWADENGELGPVYGAQWRNWYSDHTGENIDQIKQLIDTLCVDPTSRRLVVNAWNVSDLTNMALPPCHTLWQLYTDGDYLDLQLYQRSADVALGVPFNIASYSLLLSLIAKQTGYKPRYFIHTLGDAHIYLNHVDGLKEQIARKHRKLPLLKFEEGKKVCIYKPECIDSLPKIWVDYYTPHPRIKYGIAV